MAGRRHPPRRITRYLGKHNHLRGGTLHKHLQRCGHILRRQPCHTIGARVGYRHRIALRINRDSSIPSIGAQHHFQTIVIVMPRLRQRDRGQRQHSRQHRDHQTTYHAGGIMPSRAKAKMPDRRIFIGRNADPFSKTQKALLDVQAGLSETFLAA